MCFDGDDTNVPKQDVAAFVVIMIVIVTVLLW